MVIHYIMYRKCYEKYNNKILRILENLQDFQVFIPKSLRLVSMGNLKYYSILTVSWGKGEPLNSADRLSNWTSRVQSE